MRLSFLLWGALWGLSEVFLWRPLGALGWMRAPLMAALAVGLLALGAQRPLRGLGMAFVAVSLKAAAGVVWPCAMWAVLSLGLAWELLGLLARRVHPWGRGAVLSLSAPLGMLAFILVIGPDQWVSYGLVRGALAFALSWPLVLLGQGLSPKLRPGALASGGAYLAALLLSVVFG